MKKIIISVILVGFLIACMVVWFSSGSDTNSRRNATLKETRTSHTEKNNDTSGGIFHWFKNLFSKTDELDENGITPEYKALVEKINRLYEDYNLLPPEKRDEKKLILEQASLVIDYQLGPNHPKKKEFLEIVGWSYDDRQPLNKKFMSGEMTRKEFFEKLDEHFREVGKKYASIFNDDEYRAMFNMNKGENLGASMGLTPEMAEALDRRERQIPSDNLRKEDFAAAEEGTMTEEQRRNFKSAYDDPPGFYPQPKEEKKGTGK